VSAPEIKNLSFLLNSIEGIIFSLEEKMAYKIDKDACTNCGACAAEMSRRSNTRKGDVHQIDPDTCIDCGSCERYAPLMLFQQADFIRYQSS
jgi:NAD-dependent dihydropyrimidine dehydrogenase PreA subunit